MESDIDLGELVSDAMDVPIGRWHGSVARVVGSAVSICRRNLVESVDAGICGLVVPGNEEKECFLLGSRVRPPGDL